VVFEIFLREQVSRMVPHPSSLAWLLAGYDAMTLQAHLGCSSRAVLWLKLYGRRVGRRWAQDVQYIAADIGIDEALLTALLTQAEARTGQHEWSGASA
jgi:hypothetical protein